MKENLTKNIFLYRLGLVHLVIFLLLLIYLPFNDTQVLGINSVIKPIKFALSIWIYSWTMALILNYVADSKKVKVYSWVAVICMSFEQIAITSQALKGELSHFNKDSTYGIILFALMGVFILTITLWTAYIAIVFIKQKQIALSPSVALGIRIGLVYFVLFSLFGGYISGLQGHTIGSEDGGNGLFFLNWSTQFGDLRVAHFFGIHSLQIIPLVAILFQKYFAARASFLATQLFSIVYLCFVLLVMVQALSGKAFIGQ